MSFRELLKRVFKPRTSKNKHKGENVMAETEEQKEKDVTEKVETPEKSEETATGNEVAENKPETTPENSKTEENKEDNNGEQQNAEQNEEATAIQVQETEPQGNGILLNDLVTKDELKERLSAMEAKFDAIVKENQDLKNELSGMKDKYENKDFGNMQKQGVDAKQNQYETFDEYSKQFM